VATSDPANLQALEEVRFKTNLVVEAVVVEDDKLVQAIAKIVEASGANMKDMQDLEDIEIGMEAGTMPGASATIEDQDEVEDAPVVKYIQKILIDAINAGASDIHFEPYENNYRVRLRMDGILRAVAAPPVKLTPRISSRLKVMSGLDIAERRVPQDGRIKLNLSKSKSIDFRVSTCPTLFGEKVVLRILDGSAAKLGIEKLGY